MKEAEVEKKVEEKSQKRMEKTVGYGKAKLQYGGWYCRMIKCDYWEVDSTNQ